MNVGIFGGSFNPPHLAHLIVAERIRDQFGLVEVLWMPGYRPPHKAGAGLASPEHRLAMTRRATEGHPAFSVSDHEIRRGGTSYTVHTVRALQDAHPETSYALILGEDSLQQFGSWFEPEEIVARVPLIVYPRPGLPPTEPDPRFQHRVHFADAPLLNISGTAIRALYGAGHSIRYLVPDAVRAYIETHALYT
jgi:nicotinate-nucleotide adenylyltransferase